MVHGCHLWKSGDNLMGVISLLPPMGQTLINRLGGKHLYPLSRLAGPNIVNSDFKHKC